MKEVTIIEISGSKYPPTLHIHSHIYWFSIITCILMYRVSTALCDQKLTQKLEKKEDRRTIKDVVLVSSS